MVAADAEVADDPADGEPLGDEPIGETKVEEPRSRNRTAVKGPKLCGTRRFGVGRLRRGHRLGGGGPALCGWLGYRVHSQGRAERDRALFLEVGKQAAVNLTTIDYQTAEADVERILDQRRVPFRRVLRTGGSVRRCRQRRNRCPRASSPRPAVETMSAEEGQVLVAVTVQTTNRVVTEPQPPGTGE